MWKEIAKRVGRVFTITLALVSLLGMIGVFAFLLYDHNSHFVSPPEQLDDRAIALWYDLRRDSLLLILGWLGNVLLTILLVWDIFFPRAKESMPAARPKERPEEKLLVVASFLIVLIVLCSGAVAAYLNGFEKLTERTLGVCAVAAVVLVSIAAWVQAWLHKKEKGT